MSKVGALQQRVAQINPECRVDVIEDWISPENCSDLLAALVSPLHGLIDACDQVKAKVALAQWAGVRGVCFVRGWGGWWQSRSAPGRYRRLGQHHPRPFTGKSASRVCVVS